MKFFLELDGKTQYETYRTNFIFIEGVDKAGNSAGKIFLRSINVAADEPPLPEEITRYLAYGVLITTVLVAVIILYISRRKKDITG